GTVATSTGRRPAPPTSLNTEFQRQEWRAIVGRMPVDWFTRETHGLLVQYVRHAETADRMARAIDAFDVATLATPIGLEHFDRLTKIAEREGRAMSSLATRMRLTQQSRYKAETASTASKSAG